MKIRELLSEAPLADYVPLGNFAKPGPFRGVDKKLIPHEQNRVKAAKFFSGTQYDFRLFFSHISGTQQGNQEAGLVDHNRVVKTFGPEVADQILKGADTAITVVFMGNYGDSKVMMTPWIMAHRIGHAVRRGRAWQEVESHLFNTVNGILADVYNKQGYRGVDNRASKTYSALFNAIGTQRSSREGQIKRPYEFMYEMFAQYIKTGDVKLNPLPRRLGFGYQAWGRPTQYLAAANTVDDQELANTADVLSNDMRILFGDVLAECEGHVFFM